MIIFLFFFSKLRFFCAWFCKGWTWSCGLTSTRTRGFGPCTETRSEPPGPKAGPVLQFCVCSERRENKKNCVGGVFCVCVFLGAQREQGAALREPKSSGPHHHGLSCEYFQKAPRHRSRFFTFFFFRFFFHPRSRIDGGVRAKQRQVLFSGRPLRPPRALYQLFALVSSVSDVARCPPPRPPPLLLLPTTDALVIAVQPRSHGRGCKCHAVREERARAALCALTKWVLITAAAPLQGCREKTDTFNPSPKDWSAFRSTDYGYTRMQVVNASHLYLEQVSDDQVGNSLLRFLREKRSNQNEHD